MTETTSTTYGVTIVTNDKALKGAEDMLQHWSKLHGGLPYLIFGREDFERIKATGNDGKPDHHCGQHVPWLKAWLPQLMPADCSRVIFLGSNTFTIKPFLDLVPESDISAAADLSEAIRRQGNARRKQFKPGEYLSNDVLVLQLNDNTRGFCNMWWELRKRRWEVLFDQDSFNRTVLDLASHITIGKLPQICNWRVALKDPPDGVRVLNWAGLKPEPQRRALQACILASR